MGLLSRLWVRTDPVSKSANTSTADPLSDRMNINTTSGYPSEKPSEEERIPQEAAYTKESLTVKTDVPVATDAVTAGPTIVDNLPEGSSEEGCQEVIDDEWAIPLKIKKGKVPRAGVAQGGGKKKKRLQG